MAKTSQTITILLVIIAVAGILTLTFFFAGEASGTSGSTEVIQPQKLVTVWFFYGEECPHCHELIPYIQNLSQKYPEADVRILEVYHNAANQQMYLRINRQAGVDTEMVTVPEVVVENSTLSGDLEIATNIDSLIEEAIKKKS
jgi:thiol-disulfide isomerase/thioredoxin